MSLAQRVRDYRYTKGWGPDELANRAAISRTALYQIESGKTELPRAGTLQRIALALDVSMDTLLGHVEGGGTLAAATSMAAASGGTSVRTRGLPEWYPAEGTPLTSTATRSTSKLDNGDASRFGVEHHSGHEISHVSRERDLVMKLHEVLASPYGEAVARIVEESYRLLPQGRAKGGFD